MNNKWSNKNEILHDLCVAQGDVPTDLQGTLRAEDKPPPLDIKEVTEEEYFGCSGDAHDVVGPDLGQIREMLNIVRNNNVGSDNDEVKTKPIISDSMSTVEVTKPQRKKKKNKNVAITSILMNQNKNIPIDLIQSDELKKKNKEINDETEIKDEVAVELNKDAVLEKKVSKKPSVSLDPPVNMFRKKCKVKSPTSPQTSSSTDSRVNPSSSKTVASPTNSKVFTPSPFATEYLNGLKEKVKLKENIVEDIWTKAVKQMKAIEEKRKMEAALAACKNKDENDGDTSSEEDEEDDYDRSEPFDPMKMLKLPRHRHFLTKSCVICSVFQKRNINIYGGDVNEK